MDENKGKSTSSEEETLSASNDKRSKQEELTRQNWRTSKFFHLQADDPDAAKNAFRSKPGFDKTGAKAVIQDFLRAALERDFSEPDPAEQKLLNQYLPKLAEALIQDQRSFYSLPLCMPDTAMMCKNLPKFIQHYANFYEIGGGEDLLVGDTEDSAFFDLAQQYFPDLTPENMDLIAETLCYTIGFLAERVSVNSKSYSAACDDGSIKHDIQDVALLTTLAPVVLFLS